MTNIDKLKDFTRLLDEIKSISPSPETSKEVDNLMERIIRDGILPAISEQVTPLLKPTQPEPVPARESNPNEEISEVCSESEEAEDVLDVTIEEKDDEQPEYLYSLDINRTFLQRGIFNVHKKAVDRVKTIFPALTNPGGNMYVTVVFNKNNYTTYIYNINYSEGRHKTDTLQFHLPGLLIQKLPDLCRECSTIDVYVLKDKTIVLEAK